MNTLILLFHLFLIISLPDGLNQVETILEVDTSEKNNTQVLKNLKDQLQERFDRSEFKPATVEISEESGQLVVTATVNTENEKDMEAYRSMFASTSLGLWNTYRVDDDEIVQLKKDIGPIEGFDFNAVVVSEMKLFDQQVELLSNGGRDIHIAALGVCTNKEDKQRILDSLMLKTRSIPDLKLLWSPLTVDRYTKETYYVLFMIKTNGQEDALLTEAHLASVDAYQEPWTNDPAVSIQFNEEGTAIWADMTKTAALNDQRSIAIVLNGVALSAPRVMGEIPSGGTMIVSDFTLEEASDLARKLELGRLAYPLKVVSERILN